MTSAEKSFNKVTNFVKKVEGVRHDVKVVLDKQRKTTSNFHHFNSKGLGRPTLVARPIQSVMPASIVNYSRNPP